MSQTTWDQDAVIKISGINCIDGFFLAKLATDKVGFWGATPIAQPSGAGQAVVVALTDSSGGVSGGNTVGLINAASVDTSAAKLTDTAAAIATLAAKVNALNVLVTALRLASVNSGLIKGS